MYDELISYDVKKPKFKKKDFKYLKGTQCWDTVKLAHSAYNDSWASIREERADQHVQMMEMIDLMAELEFDPFFSGNNNARADFLKFMQTPYQNNDRFLGAESDQIP